MNLNVNGSIPNVVTVTWAPVSHLLNGGSPVYEYSVTGFTLKIGTKSSTPLSSESLPATHRIVSVGVPPPPISDLVANITGSARGDDAFRLVLTAVPLDIPMWYQVTARTARGWGVPSALSSSFTSLPVPPDPPTSVAASYVSGAVRFIDVM